MAVKRAPHGRLRRLHRHKTTVDGAAVRIRIAARLGVLAGLLRGIARRAGDICDEFHRLRGNAVVEHERLILQGAASMLIRLILDLTAPAYADRRGSPRMPSVASWPSCLGRKFGWRR